jgi:hypothetical protein
VIQRRKSANPLQRSLIAFFHWIAPSRQSRITGDQPRSALIREIGPRPLDQNDDAIAESDEEENVNE